MLHSPMSISPCLWWSIVQRLISISFSRISKYQNIKRCRRYRRCKERPAAMLRFLCASASYDAGVAVQTVQTQPYLLLSSQLHLEEHEESCNQQRQPSLYRRLSYRITASTASNASNADITSRKALALDRDGFRSSRGARQCNHHGQRVVRGRCAHGFRRC